MIYPTRVGLRRVPIVPLFVVTTLVAAGAATAQEPPPPQGGLSLDMDVIAKSLDIARQQIQPSLGATVYDFGRQAIETQPQGDNQSFNRLLLQAPGVTQDSFGQLHVRDEHANTQFRINGVQLPEGINVFGQALQTRLANQDRDPCSGRFGDDVRRLAVDDLPERRMGRPRRPDRLLRHRRIPAKRRGDRKPRCRRPAPRLPSSGDTRSGRCR